MQLHARALRAGELEPQRDAGARRQLQLDADAGRRASPGGARRGPSRATATRAVSTPGPLARSDEHDAPALAHRAHDLERERLDGDQPLARAGAARAVGDGRGRRRSGRGGGTRASSCRAPTRVPSPKRQAYAHERRPQRQRPRAEGDAIAREGRQRAARRRRRGRRPGATTVMIAASLATWPSRSLRGQDRGVGARPRVGVLCERAGRASRRRRTSSRPTSAARRRVAVPCSTSDAPATTRAVGSGRDDRRAERSAASGRPASPGRRPGRRRPTEPPPGSLPPPAPPAPPAAPPPPAPPSRPCRRSARCRPFRRCRRFRHSAGGRDTDRHGVRSDVAGEVAGAQRRPCTSPRRRRRASLRGPSPSRRRRGPSGWTRGRRRSRRRSRCRSGRPRCPGATDTSAPASTIGGSTSPTVTSAVSLALLPARSQAVSVTV